MPYFRRSGHIFTKYLLPPYSSIVYLNNLVTSIMQGVKKSVDMKNICLGMLSLHEVDGGTI